MPGDLIQLHLCLINGYALQSGFSQCLFPKYMAGVVVVRIYARLAIKISYDTVCQQGVHITNWVERFF